jgi:hypothetical protein
LKTGDGPAQAPSAPDDWHAALAEALEAAPSEPPALAASSRADAAARKDSSNDSDAPARKDSSEENDAPARAASNDPAVAAPSAPGQAAALRYRVQFTADQLYVDLLERARDLLWHQLPNGNLAELQRLALEALIEKLMTRKIGSTRPKTTPRPRPVASGDAPAEVPHRSDQGDTAARTVLSDVGYAAPAQTGWCTEAAPARSYSRHIPAAVRRHVWQRDGGRCTFSDSRGERCRATCAIEFHHEHPYALGGPPSAENITLRCRSHNELAAERDFGRELVMAMKHGGGSDNATACRKRASAAHRPDTPRSASQRGSGSNPALEM